MARIDDYEIREKNIKQIMDYAVKSGLERIYESNPTFRGAEGLLSRHIDFKKVRKKAEEIYSKLEENNIRGVRAGEYVKKELAEYVDEFLDEKGKSIITERESNKKPSVLEKIASLFKPTSKSEKEYETNLSALRDLYALYKSQGYSNGTSKISEPLEKVGKYLQRIEGERLGPAFAHVLSAYGKMSESEARSWTDKYKKRYHSNMKEASSHIKSIKSSLEQYIAAAVVGLVGIGLIVTPRITGAVVNVQEKFEGSILGAVLLIFALTLALCTSIKNIKKSK